LRSMSRDYGNHKTGSVVDLKRIISVHEPPGWRPFLLLDLLKELPRAIDIKRDPSEVSLNLDKLIENALKTATDKMQGLQWHKDSEIWNQAAKIMGFDRGIEKLFSRLISKGSQYPVEVREAISDFTNEVFRTDPRSSNFSERIGPRAKEIADLLRGSLLTDRFYLIALKLLSNPLALPTLRAYLTVRAISESSKRSRTEFGEIKTISINTSCWKSPKWLLPLLTYECVLKKIKEEGFEKSISDLFEKVGEPWKICAVDEIIRIDAELIETVFVEVFEKIISEGGIEDLLRSKNCYEVITYVRNEVDKKLRQKSIVLSLLEALTPVITLGVFLLRVSLPEFHLNSNELINYLTQGGVLEILLTISLIADGVLAIPHVDIIHNDDKIAKELDLLTIELVPSHEYYCVNYDEGEIEWCPLLGFVEVSKSPLDKELREHKFEKLSNLLKSVKEVEDFGSWCGAVLICDLKDESGGCSVKIGENAVALVDYRYALTSNVLRSAVRVSRTYMAEKCHEAQFASLG